MPRKIKLFSGDNIDDLYYETTKAIVTEGTELKFGSQREVKYARELFIILQIYGKAINDILAGKTPAGFIWSGKKIREFMKSFIDEIENPSGFIYTYQELLKSYPMPNGSTFNQLHSVKEKLAYDKGHDIQGNRIVGVIWNPIFADNDNSPCFNWFQIRYLGNNKVSLVILFRSHDYGSALFANLCSIAYAFYYYVIAPNLCVIDEIIVISTSGHIYENDSQLAEDITGIPWEILEPTEHEVEKGNKSPPRTEE